MKKIILFSTLANLLILGIPCCYSQNVGVNGSGSTPNSSALLDIDATGMTPQKGLLIPRVPLTSTTDAATITTPATSLLVYNTATAGTSPTNVVPGYYYNAGTSGSPNWMRFEASNSSSGGCGTVQTFTSSGTWTKPACGGIAYIRCWGAGGSGGKGGAITGGGGGGGYNEKWIVLSSLGATETVTIGAGGAGQTTAASNGNTGGTTSFGAWLSAYGGGGGNGVNGYFGGGGGGPLGAGSSIGTPGNPQILRDRYYDGTTAYSFYNGQGAEQYLYLPISGDWHGGGGGSGMGASPAGGAYSMYGGGGGGGVHGGAGFSGGGGSMNGGAGGTGATGTSGTAGTQPGGGGGATNTGATSGAGGAGQCIIIVY